MLALTVANLKMMVRNRQTTFWALFFPLILVVAFGLFDFTSPDVSKIAISAEAETPFSIQMAEQLRGIEILELEDPPYGPDEGRRLIAEGDLDFLVVIPWDFGAPPEAPANIRPAATSGPAGPAGPAGTSGAFDPGPAAVKLISGGESEERVRLVEGIIRRMTDAAVLGGPIAEGPETLVSERVQSREAPYFDIVLMGLVGMGIMTHSIISIAVRISNYRNLSILKRMLVTPLAIWKFFAAEVTAQLLLAVVQAIVILAVGVAVFGARLDGNVLNLLPVVILGSLVFLNIGFIVSAWANSPAAASGLGNVISFPMMFFAGTFFSTSTLPWLLPYGAEALPLAPMINALREIGLHGATLWDVWPELAWLAGWVAATSVAAVKVFRFS